MPARSTCLTSLRSNARPRALIALRSRFSLVSYSYCTLSGLFCRTGSFASEGACHGGQTMDDLGRFCCQNAECPDYGKRGAGNLSVCDRYGPQKQRRLLYCATCKARCSERKGTPLFGARLPEK